MGEHIEEDHRHDDGAGERDHGGDAEARGREQGLQFAAVEIGGGEPAGGPDEGGDAGEDIGRARRAVVHGLQHLAEFGAVVIGGAARRQRVRFRDSAFLGTLDAGRRGWRVLALGGRRRGGGARPGRT